MPEKCKDCCSRLFCMSVAEVNGEDFETMANKKDCRKRTFTNADRIRAMSDELLASQLVVVVEETIKALTDLDVPDDILNEVRSQLLERLKQPAE